MATVDDDGVGHRVEFVVECRELVPVDDDDRGEYELADAVGILVRAGATVEAVRYEGRRCNVNTPEDIERAEQLLE